MVGVYMLFMYVMGITTARMVVMKKTVVSNNGIIIIKFICVYSYYNHFIIAIVRANLSEVITTVYCYLMLCRFLCLVLLLPNKLNSQKGYLNLHLFSTYK